MAILSMLCKEERKYSGHWDLCHVMNRQQGFILVGSNAPIMALRDICEGLRRNHFDLGNEHIRTDI